MLNNFYGASVCRAL